MDTVTLIRLNLEIENEIDRTGDLITLPGKEVTWIAIYQHAKGYCQFFNARLPAEIRQEILHLAPQILLTDSSTVQQILQPSLPAIQVFSGWSGYFSKPPPQQDYEQVVVQDRDFIILRDGRRVSWAWTPDESERAAEIAVETLPSYRRRGLARQVASAWAAHMLANGKVAFYSYRIGNQASARLANSLGVVLYAQFTTYSTPAENL